MKKRKEINDKLVTWIVNKVTTEYAEDISLVCIYGSYINGTANSKSDVDCYFIPRTERGYKLADCFIIDGVGYDIFPMSWERVTRIADLQSTLAPLVGDARIIYCRDTSDSERFQAMQERLKSNLSNQEYAGETAAKRCEEAMEMYSGMMQSRGAKDIRKWAGTIIMKLADAVAVYNHDYYHYGLKKQFEDLEHNFLDVSREIVNGYKNVVEAADMEEVKKYTCKMLKDVCEYMNITLAIPEVSDNSEEEEAKECTNVNASWLAGLYEEICSTFNKIYVCCENNNYILAFLSAVCLQWELDDAGSAGCPAYDLLSGFDYTNLNNLWEVTQKVETDFVSFITENGGSIKKYDSFETFKSAAI